MDIQPAKRNRLTLYIGIALVAGIIAGFIINKSYVGVENTKIANADLQAKDLQQRMAGYETVKDSTRYNYLHRLYVDLETKKKEAGAANSETKVLD